MSNRNQEDGNNVAERNGEEDKIGSSNSNNKYVTVLLSKVKEEHLDKSFPLEIAKLHPILPPLSPVISSQFRDNSSKKDRSAVRQLDFQDKRDKERDNTIVPLSPERKQIVESLMQVNQN